MTASSNTKPIPPFGIDPVKGPSISDRQPGPPPVSPPGGSVDTTVPSVEFIPYVDEVEERRKFWQSVVITLAVFAVIGAVVAGVVISRRLSEPTDSKINVQYVDSVPGDSTIPTRAPTQRPTPLTIVTLQPTTSSTVRVPTPTPKVVNLLVNQRSPTPRPSGTSSSPTPTSSLLPTTTPTSSQLLPTMTASPTPYLISDTDSQNYGAVTAGLTATAKIQLLNVGSSSLTISNLFITTTGTNNPYSVVEGGGCITSASLPVTMDPGSIKCINVMYAPSYQSENSKTLNLIWNNNRIKTILLTGTVPTATPVATSTPTSTPTPTP